MKKPTLFNKLTLESASKWKLLFFIFLFFENAGQLISQAPQSIPYQAVMRNPDGTVLANNSVDLIFMIHGNFANGPVIFQESHSLMSNSEGLISCEVGQGVVSQGNFSSIDWGNGDKFLHVTMNGIDLGTQQLLSVPYALYANNVGVHCSATGDTLTVGQHSIIIPGLSAANANSPNLPANSVFTVSVSTDSIQQPRNGQASNNIQFNVSRSLIPNSGSVNYSVMVPYVIEGYGTQPATEGTHFIVEGGYAASGNLFFNANDTNISIPVSILQDLGLPDSALQEVNRSLRLRLLPEIFSMPDGYASLSDIIEQSVTIVDVFDVFTWNKTFYYFHMTNGLPQTLGSVPLTQSGAVYTYPSIPNNKTLPPTGVTNTSDLSVAMSDWIETVIECQAAGISPSIRGYFTELKSFELSTTIPVAGVNFTWTWPSTTQNGYYYLAVPDNSESGFPNYYPQDLTTGYLSFAGFITAAEERKFFSYNGNNYYLYKMPTVSTMASLTFGFSSGPIN